jgi:asparagine synthase (glutamine-hydrolysing)
LELIESNDPVLNNIPTDMGQIGEIRGIAAALRRFSSKVTFKLDYLHNEGLPHWFSPLDPVFTRVASSLKIVGLHKYLHYRSWFRKELAEYVSEILSDSRIQQNPLWNSDFLGSMASEHIRGRKNYVLELDAVITLEAVERLLFRDLRRESRPVAAIATSAAIAVAPPTPHPPIKNKARI